VVKDREPVFRLADRSTSRRASWRRKLSEGGSQFIVEAKSGAGGNVGSDFVANPNPDGYTLLFTAPGPLAVNKTLYRTPLPFDPETDFAPIAIFARTPDRADGQSEADDQQRQGAA